MSSKKYYNNIDDILDSSTTIDDKSYLEMLSSFTTDEQLKVQDPTKGERFKVYSLSIQDDALYALIDADKKIELNTTHEKVWLNEVFFKEHLFKNKREMLTHLEYNLDRVNDRFLNEDIYVEILGSINSNIYGSISNAFQKTKEIEFFEQIKNPTKSYECKINDLNKGGYLGHIDGINVFIPGSLASHKKIDDYSELIGSTIKVMIAGYVKDRNIFIVSNKRYIENIITEEISKLDLNEKLSGTITGISDFGIFINFMEYFNGLLHISEMEPETLEAFKDGKYKIDDTISFFIKTYNNKKIILSEKSFTESQKIWDELQDKFYYKKIKAKSIKKTSTGFLFEIDKNVIALLYDIEAYKYDKRIEVGKEYEVFIDRMDYKTGKIFLTCPYKK